jgi:hypothetical protein
MRLTFVAPHVTRMVPLPNPTHARAAHPSFLPGSRPLPAHPPSAPLRAAHTHRPMPGGKAAASLRCCGRSGALRRSTRSRSTLKGASPNGS